jgi:hypothetical protein
MTEVIVFRPKEKSGADDDGNWSFQYLNGFSFGDHRYF